MPGAAFGPKRICALRLMRLAVKEMVICPAAALEGSYLDMDLLLVCGGLRTPLKDTPGLSRLLQLADERGIALAGLWNGAWFLGKAGLLDGHQCAVHPENRASLTEVARNSVLTAESYILDRNRLTAAARPVLST